MKEIVSTTIESIKEGLKGKKWCVAGLIEFEIAVIKTKEGKGGLRFLIADASGKYAKESISRIKFSVLGTDTDLGRSNGSIWLNEK